LRKNVNLAESSNSPSSKKSEEFAPIEEQLGERKIPIYPNPAKGTMHTVRKFV
jgi:hypothetical protein